MYAWTLDYKHFVGQWIIAWYYTQILEINYFWRRLFPLTKGVFIVAARWKREWNRDRWKERWHYLRWSWQVCNVFSHSSCGEWKDYLCWNKTWNQRIGRLEEVCVTLHHYQAQVRLTPRNRKLMEQTNKLSDVFERVVSYRFRNCLYQWQSKFLSISGIFSTFCDNWINCKKYNLKYLYLCKY